MEGKGGHVREPVRGTPGSQLFAPAPRWARTVSAHVARTCAACALFRTRRYRTMSGEEIKLDRYAKFRKLGQFQEFVVKGGAWKEALAERAGVYAGVYILKYYLIYYIVLSVPSRVPAR